jgi:hypothetical protein
VCYHKVGTVIAGEAGMNIVGCCLVGTVAAVGGGTLNNLLAGKTPVFWIREPVYLAVCLATVCATFVLWPALNDFRVRALAEKMGVEPAAGGQAGETVNRQKFSEWVAADGPTVHRLKRTVLLVESDRTGKGAEPSTTELLRYLSVAGVSENQITAQVMTGELWQPEEVMDQVRLEIRQQPRAWPRKLYSQCY